MIPLPSVSGGFKVSMRGRLSRKIESHLGQRFGSRIVVGQAESNRWNQQMWLMRCDCGEEAPIPVTYLFQGRCGQCHSCSRTKQKRSASPNWKGLGVVSATAVTSWRFSALRRKIPWDLTIEDVAEQFERQHGKCVFTGRKLAFKRGANRPLEDGCHLASLDRIDSAKGYVRGNVQLVTTDINFAKQQLSDARFIDLCRTVVSYVDSRGAA
jgi:hypothetical protein